jgi:hypothetical protein
VSGVFNTTLEEEVISSGMTGIAGPLVGRPKPHQFLRNVFRMSVGKQQWRATVRLHAGPGSPVPNQMRSVLGGKERVRDLVTDCRGSGRTLRQRTFQSACLVCRTAPAGKVGRSILSEVRIHPVPRAADTKAVSCAHACLRPHDTCSAHCTLTRAARYMRCSSTWGRPASTLLLRYTPWVLELSARL